MNILITGAGGFLGSAIVERLLAAGHSVLACGRGSGNLPDHRRVSFRRVDLDGMVEPAHWMPLVSGVDAAVNCAGILRGRAPGEFERIHNRAPMALAKACQQAGIAPFVQISALGDPADGAFIASKQRFDDELLAMDLPAWVLRPSVVISTRGSYGGTSALRAAAGWPGLLILPGSGGQQIQPVLLADLAEVVLRAVERPEGATRPLTVAGPEVMTLRKLLRSLRAWLKLPPPRLELRIPDSLVTALATISDRFHLHPMGRTTWRMLQRGNIAGRGDVDAVCTKLGVELQSVPEVLARSASFVQDRWHARLKSLAPLGWLALVVIWLISGVTGLGTAFFMWRAMVSNNIQAIAMVAENVVRADTWFTTPAVIVQPVTGIWLAHLLGLPLTTPWILISLVLYVLVGACWIPVVFIQARVARMARLCATEGRPADLVLSPAYSPSLLLRRRQAPHLRRFARSCILTGQASTPPVHSVAKHPSYGT